MKRTLSNLLSRPRTSKCLIAEAKAGARRAALFGQFLAVLAVAGIGLATVASGATAAASVAAIFAGAFAAAALTTNGAVLGIVPRFVNYIPGLQGVAAGAIATVNAPVNRRYHSVRIYCGASNGTATDATTIVSLVELVVNGIVIRSGAPLTFINIAKTYKYTPVTGEIPIFFTEPWRNESPAAAEATSWDMAGQQTFVIRLTMASPQSGGVSIKNIIADFDGKRNLRRDSAGNMVPFLAIIKQTDISIVAASGTNDVTTIPTSWPLQRVFVDISANAISSVQFYADNNVKVWEATKAENSLLLGGNDIDASLFEYPIPFDYDDRLDSGLSTSTLDLRVVTTGAATLTFHLHQLVNGYK